MIKINPIIRQYRSNHFLKSIIHDLGNGSNIEATNPVKRNPHKIIPNPTTNAAKTNPLK